MAGQGYYAIQRTFSIRQVLVIGLAMSNHVNAMYCAINAKAYLSSFY